MTVYSGSFEEKSQFVYTSVWRNLKILFWKNKLSCRSCRFVDKLFYYQLRGIVFAIWNNFPNLWLATWEPRDRWCVVEGWNNTKYDLINLHFFSFDRTADFAEVETFRGWGWGLDGGHRILGGHFQDKILLWRLDYISFSKGLSIIASTNTSILIQINTHLLNYGCSSSISLGNMHYNSS